MKQWLFFLICMVFLSALSFTFSVSAEELPAVLTLGKILETDAYQLQLMGQPILSKSSRGMVADDRDKYLILRFGITNKTDHFVYRMMPQSFSAKELMGDKIGKSYELDYIMSAKVSEGFRIPAFFTKVNPGETLYTAVVFEVLPEADNWLITFSPSFFSGETMESVSFLIPEVLEQ